MTFICLNMTALQMLGRKMTIGTSSLSIKGYTKLVDILTLCVPMEFPIKFDTVKSGWGMYILRCHRL